MADIEPRYQLVQSHLRDGIKSGQWTVGDRLPSEAELVAQFGVSRMTVNRALRELEQEGLIRRQQGAGSFVAPLERVAGTLVIRDIHDEIAARGHRHEAEILQMGERRARRGEAQLLGLETGARLFHSRILHRENGLPLQLEERLVNPACAPDYLAQDFKTLTPTAYLLQVAPLTGAHYQIEAAAANAEQAAALGLQPGDPCLVIERVSRSPSGTVTWVRLVHPGARHVLTGSFDA
ncbi:histidine utilization repressor [Inhella sp.]|uniref:histidine utilization repressor n=1 Tax=Inhella sp. TaxID=1921806 RepID=UPI0035AE60F5